MIKKIIPLIAAFVLVFGIIQAQISVYPVNDETTPPAKDGLFYSLPRTVLKVEIVVKTTDHLKGPLSDLAEKFVGIKNAIKFDNTTYLIEDVHVTPVPEPDPDHTYFVEVGGKSSKKSGSFDLNFTRDGFLCSTFNDEKGRANKEIEQKIIFTEQSKSEATGLYQFQAFGNIKAKIDTIVRKVTVDTAIIQKLIFRARTTEKTDEELASEILNKIQVLRESKFKLLTGFQEIAYDQATIKYMHQQLENQEAEYLAMFCGKSVSSFLRYTFYYTPGLTPEKEDVALFRFSKNSGISPAMDGAGDLVTIKFELNDFSKLPREFADRKKDDGQPKGFFYRLPEKANVILNIENEEIFNKPLIINQFGQVLNLPANKVKVEFYPETGGIKSLLND